jgi:RNA polymerase sigma-70 factor (ECF subfamily)
MSTDPDSDVLACVANGDMEGALRLLMHRHGTRVYRYCREELRDAARAEDVHAKVFEQVYRDLAKFDRKSHLRTWLFAIAHHRVLDAIKAHKRELAHRGPQDEVKHIADPRPSAAEKIDDARLIQALMACLDELDDEVRRAVLLRHPLEFTFEEMSTILRVRPKTLEARVRRVMPLLRDCIERRTGGVV